MFPCFAPTNPPTLLLLNVYNSFRFSVFATHQEKAKEKHY